MNVLSLFSGIGGLDLGLERAGMTIAGQVEIDPWCRAVLARHWPEVPRHDDVRTAAQWWAGRDTPDLVAGGFPCQPVSQAGQRLAQADPRWLWPLFRDIIRDLRPRYILVENVPGLFGRGMGDVLGDLAALRYDAEWDCIPAAFVGAPHIRERVWILAYPDSQPGPRRPGSLEGRRQAMVEAEQGLQEPGRHSGGNHSLVADADSAARQPPRSPGQEVFRPGPVQRPGRRGSRRRGHWAAEPGMGRVANGIPARLDRLRALGNAVVPQVAEHIGQLILEADDATG